MDTGKRETVQFKEKVLVTGGAGYIGSLAARRLLARNFDVVVLDNMSEGCPENIQALEVVAKTISNSAFKFYEGDTRDADILTSIFKTEKPTYVMHFAASIVVPESVAHPLEYYSNNFSGVLSLLNFCSLNKVKGFVFSSTAAVYGSVDSEVNQGIVDEEAPIQPDNPYGASKAFVERMLEDCRIAHGLNYVVLRYFNVAGASDDLLLGQRTKKATHLIKVACEVACGVRPYVEIFGTNYPTKDGTAIRDYIHIEDLISAHILAIEFMSHQSTSKNQAFRPIFNCGYGLGYSVREVIKSLEKVHGAPINVREAARRVGDSVQVVANSEKIKKYLDWRPKYNDLEIICESALKWERKMRGII